MISEIKSFSLSAAFGIATICLVGCSQSPDEKFADEVRAGVRSSLKDPDSATFEGLQVYSEARVACGIFDAHTPILWAMAGSRERAVVAVPITVEALRDVLREGHAAPSEGSKAGPMISSSDRRLGWGVARRRARMSALDTTLIDIFVERYTPNADGLGCVIYAACDGLHCTVSMRSGLNAAERWCKAATKVGGLLGISLGEIGSLASQRFPLRV